MSQETSSLCQTLKTEYQTLQELQKEFQLELEKSIKSGNLEKTKELKAEIEEKLKSLKEKLITKEIKANFKNPETNETKEIKLNIQEIIQEQKQFYQKFNLPIPNEKEINQIIKTHKAEIEKEIQTYGYDQILIVPENLPNSETLNQTLIESIPDTTATYQSSSFQEGGGFQGVKSSENQKTKIILTHSDQNIYENESANPYLKATLNKNILQISSLTETQIQEKIENNQPILINFQSNQNQIQAQGLSSEEYLILQRQYFEKTSNHLDEKGWTWLTKSCSASRVVRARWFPGDRRLLVYARALGGSDVYLGCRLSRSFELT